MLAALRAFRRGDFSVRLPDDLPGTDGEIAQLFNEVVILEEQMTEEFERLSIVVGKEGKISQRGRVRAAEADQLAALLARVALLPRRVTLLAGVTLLARVTLLPRIALAGVALLPRVPLLPRVALRPGVPLGRLSRRRRIALRAGGVRGRRRRGRRGQRGPRLRVIDGVAAGRGAVITNRPLRVRATFDRTRIEGDLPAGWEAELYRNGELLGFRHDELEIIGLTARYHQKAVPKDADDGYAALSKADRAFLASITLYEDDDLRNPRRWCAAATSTLDLSKPVALILLGILLGAWWSYEVLGWGGYWAWDPVENASLMPWLTGTAFLHSIMIQEKRGMLKVWNVLLVVLAAQRGAQASLHDMRSVGWQGFALGVGSV